MTVRFSRITLSLAAIVVVACAPKVESPRVLSDQDLTALRAIADRDAPLVRARNWAELSAEYADDAVRMPPNGSAVVGRAAIRKMLDETPPISAFDFRLVDLKGDGEIAFMRAAWSITVAPPGAAKPVSDSGKILIVFRRQSDGSWLRVADAWNSDVAPAK